jgi:hypothetical protein
VLLSAPLLSQGVWRIRHNEELYEMCKDVHISTYIQMKNLRWAGHVKGWKTVMSQIRFQDESLEEEASRKTT